MIYQEGSQIEPHKLVFFKRAPKHRVTQSYNSSTLPDTEKHSFSIMQYSIGSHLSTQRYIRVRTPCSTTIWSALLLWERYGIHPQWDSRVGPRRSRRCFLPGRRLRPTKIFAFPSGHYPTGGASALPHFWFYLGCTEWGHHTQGTQGGDAFRRHPPPHHLEVPHDQPKAHTSVPQDSWPSQCIHAYLGAPLGHPFSVSTPP